MSEIQDIKDKIVLSEIIGRHVKLTPTGAYQRGLCPFHHEKTPSFHVNDQLGFYKCFGCGEGGDVFTFLEKYEGMTFREALEYLAELTGVTLTNRQQSPEDILRAKVLEILELATTFYVQKLESAAGQAARDYLATRGTSSSLIKQFKLGAAPDEWHALTSFLQSKKFTKAQILASGLARQNATGRLYDTFRDRLMFPLRNHRGQVVGFSGRQLKANPNEGKYINTPETIVYHKGKMLYGLFEHAKVIRQAKTMLIVEGEFDMLSSSQAGVDFVCAIKGSALTSDHADLIARYTDKVILALDSDEAGIKATKKAIAALRPHQVELRVVMLEGNKDPDEQARADAEVWRQKVKTAISVYEFFIRVITSHHDLHSIDGQKKILQELGQVFPLIDNRLEYEFYLKKVAKLLEQDLDVVRADILQWSRLGEINANTAATVTTHAAKAHAKPDKMKLLEAYVWFLFLQCLAEGVNVPDASTYVIHATWQTPFLEQLARAYDAYYRVHPDANLRGWHQSLPADFQEKVALLSLNKTFIKYLSKTDLVSEWRRQSTAHERAVASAQIAAMTEELAKLDEIDDPTLAQEKHKNELLQKIVELKKFKKH